MKKIVLGTIIIFAGLFLLAENFGFLNSWIKHVIFSWPMILIVIGSYLGGIIGMILIVPAVAILFALYKYAREEMQHSQLEEAQQV